MQEGNRGDDIAVNIIGGHLAHQPCLAGEPSAYPALYCPNYKNSRPRNPTKHMSSICSLHFTYNQAYFKLTKLLKNDPKVEDIRW